MKLEGLRIFHQQLVSELAADSITTHLYYFFKNSWHDLATESACSTSESTDLNRCKNESIAYHATNSLSAWFYLSTHNIAIRLIFPQSPQLPTRRRNRDRILKIQENAINAYKVSHSPLTQLLAREAFRDKLGGAIEQVDKPVSPGTEAEESTVPRALVAMALDIDHFKQVNDTWGHLYGDQVLKTFGRRLENCAELIRSSGGGKPVVHLGHPSGEEFLIFIQANATKEQFYEWANDFKKAISDQVLPSELEWQWLATAGGVASLTPPPLQDRVITTSIGISYHNSAPATSGIDAVSDLLDRADTALYRAKAAGRNQVISFDEILNNCGRVIEQDVNTHVIALDIGSNVGVAIGQEFKVFLPTFTGKTKFLLNDGRTKRTLGIYPRVESARIVVFNVQPEISFAYIAAPNEQAPTLEAGSHLEAIPTGSIGHLLPSFSKYFSSSPSTSDQNGFAELQSFVKSNAEKGSPFAIVIRFTRENEYLRRYGSVALNAALAQIYRDAQLTFHAAKAVEVLDRGSICVVGAKTSYKESLVTEFVERMAVDLPELGVFGGVFCDADREKIDEKLQAKLDSANAIEFARFAAADAGRPPDARVRHFNYDTAYSALQALREARSFDIAYADFERLRKLGVESPSISNLGGLIAGNLGHIQQACEHYTAAILKDPENLIYKSNYGTAAYKTNEIDAALKVLNALSTKDIDKLKTQHEYGYLGYARLLARAKLNASPMFDQSRFDHVAQNALELTKYANSSELAIIRDALQK